MSKNINKYSDKLNLLTPPSSFKGYHIGKFDSTIEFECKVCKAEVFTDSFFVNEMQ
jgi:hypothetical protein